MNRVILILVVIAVGIVATTSYLYNPTENEIQEALDAQKPKHHWGFQARQERNVRVLCIGGSNTVIGSYTKPLNAFLINSTAHPSWNGSLEAHGMSGVSPEEFIGAMYAFELRSKDTWPNVILLDFSMNTYKQVKPKQIGPVVDAVIRTIQYKYKQENVPVPDVMFLELFFVKQLITFNANFPHATVEQKMNYINQNSSMISPEDIEYDFGAERGCPACNEFRAVADFYGYSTVSWRNLCYSAFLRNFLNEQIEENYRGYDLSPNHWLYTNDGLHINLAGGTYLADTLFDPFFNNVMHIRKETPSSRDNKLLSELHMYELTSRPMQLLAYTMWSPSPDTSVHNIVRKPTDWKIHAQRTEVDGMLHGTRCIGTSSKEAILNVDFVVPNLCNGMTDCKVSAGFLHSWNTSFVGNLTCSLRSTVDDKVLLDKRFIATNLLADGREMLHTSMVQSVFDVPLRAGKHSMTCEKVDSRHSCLAGVFVSGSVIV